MTAERPMSDDIGKIIDGAIRQIPPLWPLAAQVAVNPYLGQTHMRLAETAALLEKVGGGPVTMPIAWYQERLEAGEIARSDLADALAASPYHQRYGTLEAFEQALGAQETQPPPLPTLAELAAQASGTDWSGIVADRIGAWAATHFDAGQALWTSTQGKPAWSAYRIFATHDLTPEILGLKQFAAFAADAPDNARDAIARAVARLSIDRAALQPYFHRLLLSLGGYGQYARYLLWQAELSGGADRTLVDLLAVRLLWEEALFEQHAPQIGGAWSQAKARYAAPAAPRDGHAMSEILQEAYERAGQRRLTSALAPSNRKMVGDRPALQAAFCIDVRSEVYRRSLESLGPGIRTLGFAGFFGLAVRHRRFASDIDESRLPVLLDPPLRSCATAPSVRGRDQASRIRARARRAWGRFKMAAVSSFAFVEAMGPIYGVKLLRDAAGFAQAGERRQPRPHFDPPLEPDARAAAAETVLRAMSLTKEFARIVLLVGHGANVVNNPHASALHCGACGGYPGDVNTRLLADILNDPAVRAALARNGIAVPADTLFLAALHDTTTDDITIYDQDADVSRHEDDLARARRWFAAAGKLARLERALRLPRANGPHDVQARSRDWAEIRPELGLAGCQAFIAAPRARTAGCDLKGRAFLHDYDWRRDSERGYPVLELIMTAPVVVASWISLQYYGSTVAPDVFGAGNKLLHNVVGGIGVLEGNGGLMRGGLPWQSLHDGERLLHEPLRLSVCVEAPREAVADVLHRHPEVRALFDNRWLHLFIIDDAGQIAWRYCAGSVWEPMPSAASVERTAA